VRDPLRAARLRPGGGSYWDFALGAERVHGPFVGGVRWTGTTIGDARVASAFVDRHTGSRLSAYMRIALRP
jgi:hypothetical protein